MNWQSQAGSHSCSFDIDWLKKHDYTTPSVHKQRIQDEIPLIAVCNTLRTSLKMGTKFSTFNENHQKANLSTRNNRFTTTKILNFG